MSATAAVTATDRNLEDQIFQLQKMDLDSRVKEIVEEAAQLSMQGRHLEAAALVEKAEAMRAAIAAETPSAGLPPAETQPPAEGEQVVARLVGDVANGLAKVLVSALQDLEQHIAGETRKLATSFNQQLDRLQTTVESLLPLGERIEQLAGAIAEQKAVGLAAHEKCSQLAAETALLREADGRYENALGSLRAEMQERTASVSERLEALTGRLGLQQEEISAVKSSVSDLSPRVATLVERLDRQAEAIRCLYETESHRGAAMDELVNAMGRLRALHLPPPEQPATQL
ncbi:MAG TPA: hypothetical protein VFA54_14450 [Bryobacterales bacterium]|nr:hypothetical protein [Bryobacterales bacterium]